jgi:hypothetical protein
MRVSTQPSVVFALLVASCFLGPGCETAGSNTAGGALVGTGLGAVTGAIIGSATGRGNAAAGALIGAAAGGVGGALIGNAQDKREQQADAAVQAQYTQAQVAAERAALTNNDIVYMAKSNVGDGVIINSIRSRGGRFDTTPDAIVQLKANGISDAVIQTMQSTPPPSATVPPPGAVAGGPYYAPGVVVAPAPLVGVYVRPRPYYYGYGWRRW